MHKYSTILYFVCILLMEIVTADNPEEYDAATWLTQSKDLQTSSDKLQDQVCVMMRNLGEPCDEGVRRKSLISAMKSKIKSKFTDFIALHFMNKRIVVCLRQSFQNFPLTMGHGGGGGGGGRCTLNPLKLLRKAVLHIISNTETGIRSVIREVKNCVNEAGGRLACFKTLHKRILAKSVKAIKSLIQTVSGSIKTVVKFPFQAILCTVQGVKSAIQGALGLGKCVFCAYMPSRCKSADASDHTNSVVMSNDPMGHTNSIVVSNDPTGYQTKSIVMSNDPMGQKSIFVSNDPMGHHTKSIVMSNDPMGQKSIFVSNSPTGIKSVIMSGGPPQPSEPYQPSEPDQPVQPNEPNEPNEPSEPNQPNEPNEPYQPNEPNEPNQPNEPNEPNEPNQPNEPNEPNQPNEPNEPNQPNEPNEPNEPNQPNEPNEPNQPNEPNEPNQPSEAIESSESSEISL